MAYTTIKKPSEYFNTVLYTGNGSTNAITGVGFQPDWVWVKGRTNTPNHYLFDSVRGVQKNIHSNTNDTEATGANTLTAFGSDGFTLGSDGDPNGSGQNYVGWNWLGANGTSANTDGSISSTVSANTTSGFSIVSWTGNNTNGATVGHGLGTAPDVVFFKNRTGAPNSWHVYHSSFANATDLLLLDGNASLYTSNNYISGTRPSSSVLTLGNSAATNENSQTIIAYCFAEKQGFSKFGSYTGNGNANGTFVYTGFKPAWLMIKRTDAVNNWIMLNNKMSLYNNNTGDELYADLNASQNSFVDGGADFLSNGFKLRGTNASVNASGGTYIYMAFAEQPLVGDNPATAR
jgi:hypothetical protein